MTISILFISVISLYKYHFVLFNKCRLLHYMDRMRFIYSIFIILGLLKSQSLNVSHVRKKNQITNGKQDSASVFLTPWPFPQGQSCSSSGPSCCDFYIFVFTQCGCKCWLKRLPLDSPLLISLVSKWSDTRYGLERVPGQGLSTSHSEPGEIRKPTSIPPYLPLFRIIFLKKSRFKICIYPSTINVFFWVLSTCGF